MSKVFTLLLVFLFINLAYSQDPKDIHNSEVKGLYLTLEDFQNNQLSCSTDNTLSIKLKQFFISPEITCVEADKETVYYKDSLFAIHLSNGENFRFVNRNPCLIEDTLFLYIYKYTTIETEYKQYGPTHRSKKIPVAYYYFSAGEHRDVYPLTLANLSEYWHVDPHVQQAIGQKFNKDEQLYAIDQQTGHYLLNEFLNELSIKSSN